MVGCLRLAMRPALRGIRSSGFGRQCQPPLQLVTVNRHFTTGPRPSGTGPLGLVCQRPVGGANSLAKDSVFSRVLFGRRFASTEANAPKEQSPKEQDKEGGQTDSLEFEKSEKALQASKVNLAAKLSKRDATVSSGSTRGDIMRLFSLVRGERLSLAFAIMCLLVSSAVSVSLPTMIGKILDATNDQNAEIFGLPLNYFYPALGAVFVVGGIANYGRVVLLRTTGERLVAKLRARLYRKTISQDGEFFDANRVGDLISRLSSDVNIVAKSLTQNVSDGLRSGLQCTAAVGMMCYTSLSLTSVMGILVPVAIGGSWIYGRRLRKLSRDLQQAIGKMTKVSEERLSNIKTAQTFAGEIQEMKLYNDKIRSVFSIGKKEAIAAGLYFGSSGVIGNLTLLTMLGIGSGMVSSGAMSIGQLTTFTMYAGYAGMSAFGLASFYGELMKGVGAASRVFELFDREPEIRSTIGRPVKNARDVITFDHVKFSYPTRPAVTIFEDLNFSIPAGSNVCIVGPSGGGKSTITSLLLRFYDPTAGRVMIGDDDIKDLNLKSLRRHIGVVSQEPVLFSGTIADNIRYGKPDATRFEILEAARRANCGFISDFPDGVDTYVGARGAQLSGGQKQRIAIARALIKKPSILILDEATSALDAESEAAVNEALINLMKDNCTTISIAHRLSTIRRSDSVVVLSSDGRVAEQGNFNELYARPDSHLSYLLRTREDDDVVSRLKQRIYEMEEQVRQERADEDEERVEMEMDRGNKLSA
uniref:ARAD1C13288p n=1 Tax=Blastobotrys adeninivorans TaxID=409370 RepID=A0A060T128_BLAAD